MLEIEKPRIECVEHSDDNTYAKFVVEPLERGYGITLEIPYAVFSYPLFRGLQ